MEDRGLHLEPRRGTLRERWHRLEDIVKINSRIRLVRLRPQFASLYPGLDPGVWETATELAARLLAQHTLQPSPGHMLSNRILPEEHFEFMGGTPRGPAWTGVRSRVSDKA